MTLPLLIVIPHGGIEVPDELAGYENLTADDIFFESDAGANRIFYSGATAEPQVLTSVSRLFVDTDRDYNSVHPLTADGVIKTRTSGNRDVFKKNCYPDEIAISNILGRYYFPFHESIRDAVRRKNVELIIQCRTHAAVGPASSHDAGRPRPLVMTGYTADSPGGVRKTAAPEMAMELASILGRMIQREGETVSDKYRVAIHDSKSYIMRNYGRVMPAIELSVSRSLFLNDRYFDLESLTIDNRRLDYIGGIIFAGIEKFCARYL